MLSEESIEKLSHALVISDRRAVARKIASNFSDCQKRYSSYYVPEIDLRLLWVRDGILTPALNRQFCLRELPVFSEPISYQIKNERTLLFENFIKYLRYAETVIISSEKHHSSFHYNVKKLLEFVNYTGDIHHLDISRFLWGRASKAKISAVKIDLLDEKAILEDAIFSQLDVFFKENMHLLTGGEDMGICHIHLLHMLNREGGYFTGSHNQKEDYDFSLAGIQQNIQRKYGIGPIKTLKSLFQLYYAGLISYPGTYEKTLDLHAVRNASSIAQHILKHFQWDIGVMDMEDAFEHVNFSKTVAFSEQTHSGISPLVIFDEFDIEKLNHIETVIYQEIVYLFFRQFMEKVDNLGNFHYNKLSPLTKLIRQISTEEEIKVYDASHVAHCLYELLSHKLIYFKGERVFLSDKSKEIVDAFLNAHGQGFFQRLDEQMKKARLLESADGALKVINNAKPLIKDFFSNLKRSMEMSHVLCKCPMCKEGDIVEGVKAFGCSRWREEDGGCKFVIWKTIAGKKVTEQEALELIKGEVIGPFNLTKKDGSPFTASFKFDLEQGKVVFVFNRKK